MAISRFKTSTLAQGLPKYTELWDQSTVISSAAYESIATVTGTGSNQVLTFNSIPGTYKHLQIRANLTTSGLGGSSTYGGWVTFNGDTGTNYSDHSVYADGSGNASYSVLNRASMGIITYTTNSTYHASNIIDILDYTDTNKYTTAKSISGSDFNGSGFVTLQGGNWRNTNAVTSVSLYLNAGFGAHYFTTNCSATLYGIKG